MAQALLPTHAHVQRVHAKQRTSAEPFGDLARLEAMARIPARSCRKGAMHRKNLHAAQGQQQGKTKVFSSPTLFRVLCISRRTTAMCLGITKWQPRTPKSGLPTVDVIIYGNKRSRAGFESSAGRWQSGTSTRSAHELPSMPRIITPTLFNKLMHAIHVVTTLSLIPVMCPISE